jgi:membrane fusion protein (multidrug efflux system)
MDASARLDPPLDTTERESDARVKEKPARKAEAAPAALAPPRPIDPEIVAKPSRSHRKTLILALVFLGAAGAAAHFGWHWWTTGRFEETTDDAFLQADKVVVAPKVGGFVAEVFAQDNQPVKAGQVIARLDDRDFRVVLLQDQADLDKAQASLDGVASALIQQEARIAESKADVANTKAGLDFATEEEKRYRDLLGSGAGTTQRSHQAVSDLLQKQAAADKAKAGYDAALKQTDGLRSLEAAARASLQRSQINLEQAKLNLGYTTVTAPIDGVVGDRALRLGQLVQPGSNMLTIVPMGKAIYLIANFKETQIGDMVEGRPARFTVDAFGDHVFHGTIDSFAPGTGSQFALLPPENATGNFTKVVQRVPVKIKLDGNDPLIARLRPGLSAEAVVDTRGDASPK